jgi:serine/threonine-protein kinase
MGIVYEVEHVHTGQRLALKVLSSQLGGSVERFKREARAASLIRSDHIVLVTDADVAPELNDTPFLVMELLEGSDLERATGSRPASHAEVVGWLQQVARALGKAHEAGLVHRDLKPENLFLTRREDGTPLVKILDFGIAKMTAEGAGLTSSDTFLGTPGYMAPEQMDSKGPPITPRADLYALGLIAFKLLNGRPYWLPGTLGQLLAQILAEPMPPASERGSKLGPQFDAWFAKACDRDPQRRFSSAEEQVEALAEALAVAPETPRDAARVARTSARTLAVGPQQIASSLHGSSTDLPGSRRRTARRRLFGVGGLGALVVAFGVTASVLRVRPTTPTRPAVEESRPAARPTPPEPALASEPAPALAASASSASSSASSPSDAAAVAPPPAAANGVPKRPPAAHVASSTPSTVLPQPSAPPPSPPPAPSADPLGKLRRL